MKKNALLLSIIIISLFLQACRHTLPIETDMSEIVADFSFTTQDNKTLELADLEGKWWIADFIFTNCETVCLPMTHHMSLLQDQLKEEEIPIQFVSFSVDPEYDSPEVLKAYGEAYHADFSNWTFLTGYDFQTIKELSIKSFRALLKEPDFGSDQVTHDVRFFLVDPTGTIVKGYNGTVMDNIEVIVDDIITLDQAGFITE